MQKNQKTAGVCEKTPSKSEYFSWLNNTNEGSTEKQTLINLAFFEYLQKEFGLKLDIYAWDAGNLDGSCGQYKNGEAERKEQFPRGYAPIAEAAEKIGARLGVWGGADGYGDDEKSAEARRKTLVDLCKNYNWALFKFDAVCGGLRPEKTGEFAKTMIECRKYSPDLILLNHRNDLGDAEIYASTFLWNGQETYVDVLSYNGVTAPHHRAFIFERGYTPDLQRLTEDHGVCFNSFPDYFEDDLVYQAFNRSLILAPEIYGNPWFLRDDEYALLARIFNYHRRYNDILTSALTPCEKDVKSGLYGDYPVFRGNRERRFFVSGNASWAAKKIALVLNEECIGLERPRANGKICVTRRFPDESFIGEFEYGETAELELPPFRAALYEICHSSVADEQITGCEYSVLHETCGKPDKINVLRVFGKIEKYNPATGERVCLLSDNPLCGKKQSNVESFDISLKNPIKLGVLSKTAIPENDEELYEKVYFSLDNDSLERRAVNRSGESEIECVRAARNAFFGQDSYRLRGLESNIPFDGDPNSVFDVKSKSYKIYGTGFRVEGGCLRIDLGEKINADRFEIEYFDAAGQETETFFAQKAENNAEISADLKSFSAAPLISDSDVGAQSLEYFAFYKDVKTSLTGRRKRAVYLTEKPLRYIRIPDPLNCIFTIKFFNGAEEIKPENIKLNNLFAPQYKKKTKCCLSGKFSVVEPGMQNAYIACACDGKTGNEGITVFAKIDGEIVSFPDRAPAYPTNAFESPVCPREGNYTFYLPIKREWKGKQIEITALISGFEVPVTVYVCDGKTRRDGIILSV